LPRQIFLRASKRVFWFFMNKKDKPVFVKKLSDELANAKSVVLVDFSGLTVKAQQDLKKRFKESNSKMLVVKNTLFKLAAEDAKLPKETLADTVLTGQTAVITSGTDPVSPIQILGKFAKESVSVTGEPLPKFKVGVIEGKFQDSESLVKISTLPGKDVLLGQVLGNLMAPEYGLVSVLNANMQKLIFVLSEAGKRG